MSAIIKIGLLLPLEDSVLGANMESRRKAFKFSLDLLNTEFSGQGVTFQDEVVSTYSPLKQDKFVKVTSAVEDVLGRGVVGIVGEADSSNTREIAIRASAAGVLVGAPSSTAAILTNKVLGRTLFRVTGSDDSEMAAWADYLLEIDIFHVDVGQALARSCRRVAVLHSLQDFATGSAAEFVNIVNKVNAAIFHSRSNFNSEKNKVYVAPFKADDADNMEKVLKEVKNDGEVRNILCIAIASDCRKLLEAAIKAGMNGEDYFWFLVSSASDVSMLTNPPRTSNPLTTFIQPALPTKEAEFLRSKMGTPSLSPNQVNGFAPHAFDAGLAHTGNRSGGNSQRSQTPRRPEAGRCSQPQGPWNRK